MPRTPKLVSKVNLSEQRLAKLLQRQPLDHLTFGQQTRWCNKPTCTRDPHGPYWYAWWRDSTGQHNVYIGLTLPDIARQRYVQQSKPKRHHRETSAAPL